MTLLVRNFCVSAISYQWRQLKFVRTMGISHFTSAATSKDGPRVAATEMLHITEADWGDLVCEWHDSSLHSQSITCPWGTLYFCAAGRPNLQPDFHFGMGPNERITKSNNTKNPAWGHLHYYSPLCIEGMGQKVGEEMKSKSEVTC